MKVAISTIGQPLQATEPSDGELLERFIMQKDDGAFSTIMHRHGRMVFAMARRLLQNPADADDVCQATFLVLARKAYRLDRQRSLAGWLFGVARRLCADLRKMNERRQRHEANSARMQLMLGESSLLQEQRLQARQIDDTLAGLPRKYREPLLLCYWEGLSKPEATQRLGWKPGTFSGRLARAKALLKRRLEQLGIVPGILLAWFSGAGISQAFPTLVTSQAARQALMYLPGIQTLTSPAVFQLVHGVLRSMYFSHLKFAAACLAAVGCFGILGAGALSMTHADDPGAAPTPTRSTVQSGQTDQDRIQGKWHCVALAMGGNTPEGARKDADTIRDQMWMDFKGDKVLISGSPAEKDPAKYTLVTTANPKQIVIEAGPMKLQGIYTLEEGLLVFRYGEDASNAMDMPKSFALGAKSTGILFVMQREKSSHQGVAAGKLPLGAVAQSTPMALAENNMRQIAVAVHNYAAAHNALPDNVYDKDGKALLSWRVKLLPYLEKDNIAKLFKMDEPWDSAHNKELIKQMPAVFTCPTVPGVIKKEAGTTPFRAFMGKDTLHTFNKKIKFSDIKDGTSNTFLFVEAAEEVPWTCPNDLVHNREQPFPKVGGRFGNSFFAAFCDGTVRPLTVYPNKVSLNVVPYFNMVTPAGGEKIETGR